jgi:DNA-3-methyladenine glycosylase II
MKKGASVWRIRKHDDLKDGLAFLAQSDPHMARAIKQNPVAPLRLRPQGYASLVGVMVHQQLSLASAGAILKRLEDIVQPLTAENILHTDQKILVDVGLGKAKARYALEIARAVQSGALKFGALRNMSDDDARSHLQITKGIGPWTAEIYLLSCLGRPDAWPSGDVGLQGAYHALAGLNARPTAEEMNEIAERWRPWRGVAARVLWAYYRDVKGIKQIN